MCTRSSKTERGQEWLQKTTVKYCFFYQESYGSQKSPLHINRWPPSPQQRQTQANHIWTTAVQSLDIKSPLTFQRKATWTTQRLTARAENQNTKNHLRIEPALDFLDTGSDTVRQNLFTWCERDLADFVAEKTNEALIFQLSINPLNIHTVLKFDQLKNGSGACIQGNFIVHI